LAVELGVALDGGQRGAELVGGVGDEAAHAGFGLGLGSHGLFDAVEHGVECGAEVADLAGGVRCGEAGGQLAIGDPFGSLDHVVDRPEATPDAAPHDGCGNGQGAGAGGQQDPPDFGEGGIDVGERGRDDQQATVGQPGGDGPVAGPSPPVDGRVTGAGVAVRPATSGGGSGSPVGGCQKFGRRR
jgi:hypothetical protein